MKVYTDLKHFKARNPVVTIGTFDGVHLGHKKVIGRLTEIARSIQGESVIFTFYPHPRLITSPNEINLRLLTTLEEKKNLLAAYGVDNLIVFPFTKEFSETKYTDFVKEILIDKLKTACLVVGYDHRFGKDREGGYEYLEECAKKHNFSIEELDAFLLDEFKVSSTIIRNAIEAGEIQKANAALGYRFMIHGHVVEGKRIGRLIGFPTANIETSDNHKIIPGYGVYAVEVLIKGVVKKGMLNIGTRPTFNNNADNRSIEVNIFDFNENIYGQEITLFFVGKIREERKFAGASLLVEQLKTDRMEALKILDLRDNHFDGYETI